MKILIDTKVDEIGKECLKCLEKFMLIQNGYKNEWIGINGTMIDVYANDNEFYKDIKKKENDQLTDEVNKLFNDVTSTIDYLCEMENKFYADDNANFGEEAIKKLKLKYQDLLNKKGE